MAHLQFEPTSPLSRSHLVELDFAYVMSTMNRDLCMEIGWPNYKIGLVVGSVSATLHAPKEIRKGMRDM